MSSQFDVNESFAGDDHEAVVRELMRGHELTEQLQTEALRVLRGQGQAEATAVFILQEVSRAFTVCLSILNSPGRVPVTTAGTSSGDTEGVPGGGRMSKDETTPRKRIITSWPHFDGYQWRKYGQKRILRSNFPRCYFRCSYHRDRNCPATKQVQQQNSRDPPLFQVVYVHEHTCNTTTFDRELTTSTNLLHSRQDVHILDHGAIKEEQERQALVSSLASVLGDRGGKVPETVQDRTIAAAPVGVSDPRSEEGLDMDYAFMNSPWLASLDDVQL